MKITLIITLITGFHFVGKLSAQESITLPQEAQRKTRFSELGMNLYSLGLIRADQQYYTGEVVDQGFFNGFYYKYFKGRNALRTSFNYFQKITGNFYNPGYFYPLQGNGVKRSGELKAGYQYLFGNKKLSAYFFVDARYCYSTEEGVSSYDYWLMSTRIDGIAAYPGRYPYNYLVERTDIGICKGLGLRWNIADKLTLNLETQFEYYYFIQQDLKNSYGKRTGTGIAVDPIHFSVGFKF
jgi:hypothetical protein